MASAASLCTSWALKPSSERGALDLNFMVGETGLEPATPSPPDWCANHLRYSPRLVAEHIRQ